MIKTILTRVLNVVLRKPIRLWAISLLCSFLTSVFSFLCGITIPGLSLCISLLMSVGMTMVFLHGYRGEQPRAVQLFDAFKDWGTIKRTLCGMGWMTLWIFLWALIPIVGIVFAIIRSYEYRLTPYILVNEPDVKPTEAIKVSKERTNGYKTSMFLTDLIPAAAVCLVVLVLALLGMIPKAGVVFLVIMVIFLILAALVLPLVYGLIKSAYYEEISHPTLTSTGREMVFCPYCGESIDADAVFCPKCGRRVGGAAEIEEEPKIEEEAVTEGNEEIKGDEE